MASINAFYRSAGSGQYATQLFTSFKSPSATTAPWGGGNASSSAASVSSSNSGTADRAIARIIEILALGTGSSTETASVDEALGYITGASGTKGDDTLNLKGKTVYNVSTGAGDDVINAKTTSAAVIDSGDGNDQINLAARYINDITAGAGDDKIEVSAKLALSVDGGDGKDTIKVAADTIIGVSSGAGDDNLYLEGARISASGGTGNDTVTFNIRDGGVAEYGFARGDGQDIVSSNGPLSVRLSGYRPSDVTVTTADNKLTLTFKGTDDKITVSFDKGALDAIKPGFSFVMEKGATMLKIG